MYRHQRQFSEVFFVLQLVYCKSVQCATQYVAEGTINNKPNAVISFVVA